MKNYVTLFFVLCCFFSTYAQQPKEGLYQSADGAYQFSLKNLSDSSIEVTESNMTSVYNKSGNAYQHSTPKYAHFMMRVNGPTEIVAFKTNTNQETKYAWIGNMTLSEEDCPLAEKYQDLAEEGNPEVQAYSFCAAAALMKCSYTPQGFAAYAATMVKTMKLIIVDAAKCPCTDVIPQSIWDAN